jgi:hypothetical protein
MKHLAIILALTSLAAAQQHAPSREQCNADANLWDVTHEQLSLVASSELFARSKEMSDCALAYFVSNNERRLSRYDQLADVYTIELWGRMMSFFGRHPNLKQQFFNEDAAGLR